MAAVNWALALLYRTLAGDARAARFQSRLDVSSWLLLAALAGLLVTASAAAWRARRR